MIRNRIPAGTLWWLAALAAAAAADVAVGRRASLTVTLVFAPFVASTLRPVRETAVAAASAVVAAAVLGVGDAVTVTSPHAVRVIAVSAGGGLAIWLAITRCRREVRLLAISRVAEIAQQAILHAVPRTTNYAALASAYHSATAEARIGGDFYDVVDSPYGTRIVLGDVRGKGLDAVRLAAELLGEFRSRARTEPTLADVVEHVETAAQAAVDAEEFATAVFLELRDRTMEIVRCGHPHPLLATSGCVEELATRGTLPLGLGADGKTAVEITLSPHARLLLYSDGAIETRDSAGADFDLCAAFADVAALAGDIALSELIARLTTHGDGHLGDDVVLLLVEPTAHATEGLAAG
ncbi:MAG: serine/threonine-protein phosphatase [Chloroflexi bacterium]|nr:serine/threonine-protein phosphatase [Chloroflexota bacterium]